jgi:hypothetical protein
MEISAMTTKKATAPKALSDNEMTKAAEHFAENNSTPPDTVFDPHNAQQPFRRPTEAERAEGQRDVEKMHQSLGELREASEPNPAGDGS